jgi:hypothetical protein
LAQQLVCIEALNAGLAAERTARQVAEVRAAAYAGNLDDLRFSLSAPSVASSTSGISSRPTRLEPAHHSTRYGPATMYKQPCLVSHASDN